MARSGARRRSRKRRQAVARATAAPERPDSLAATLPPEPSDEPPAGIPPADSPPERSPAPRARRTPDRPPPLWGPFPLTEIAIGAGLVAMIVGFARGPGGTVPMIVGFAVCALAVLELVAREHFAGVRSHALLLALAPTVVLETVLYVAGLRGPYLLAAALPLYAWLVWLLRGRFARARDVRALRR